MLTFFHCDLLALACANALLVQEPGPPPTGPSRPARAQIKPDVSDVIGASIYADNCFAMYFKGKLVAVDPIDSIPQNQVNIDLLPEYPMTIAIIAKDNADPNTGLGYCNHIGNAGFILKCGAGTITDGNRCLFYPVAVEYPSGKSAEGRSR